MAAQSVHAERIEIDVVCATLASGVLTFHLATPTRECWNCTF
jgi:hypothetical protein